MPAKIPGASGDRASSSNAFLSPAGSWGVAAHEGLPGHALQLGMMLENGVSLARRIFGWDMATTEGWAVYAETELMPWLPDEGRLICLRRRLLRAARSFLDPGLQQGRYTPEQVSWILRHKVGVPAGMAESEIARCTVLMPGQATAYFCGYCRYADLRAEVELGLGPDFDCRMYHDFLLAQGLLPVRLLRKHVLETFVPLARCARELPRGGKGKA
ncbi:MAG: DUF885 domain-containing protein [bacterium]|nr:DUF885 domain-containing protein [bacterium]